MERGPQLLRPRDANLKPGLRRSPRRRPPPLLAAVKPRATPPRRQRQPNASLHNGSTAAAEASKWYDLNT